MYENITGEELKALPDEEKKTALEELMEKYPDKKELAERLGVKGNVVGIWIAKYVLGQQMGRQKGQTATTKTDIEPVIAESNNGDTASLQTHVTALGEEVRQRIVGIGNALLDNKTYEVTLTVNELPAE
ncbi:MAG: hypothetical protein WDA59_00195 [Methanofastidiosum sp.]|jgi:hypothetical protein